MVSRDGKSFQKSINLALQGGGSHGAYTWGVLDRFLEDGRIFIEAISGTSAGAMNAVVMSDGLVAGKEEGAREALHQFWWDVSQASAWSPMKRGPLDVFMGNWTLDNSPSFLFFDMLNRIASPYDMNPMDINPLRDIVERRVDIERVRRCDQVRIYISATNVETGKVKVFKRDELTYDMIMASACLPFMFKAVEIDGIPYWDGGYMGNPVLFPFYHSVSDDVVIVQINPLKRAGTPKKAREILDRVNEITFNSSLLKELRAIEFVRRLIDEGKLDRGDYKRLLMHVIEAEADIKPLGASSKLNAEWDFLCHLFNIGRAAADRWLAAEFDHIGERATVNLRAMFRPDDLDH